MDEEIYDFISNIIEKIENYEERQKARQGVIQLLDKGIEKASNEIAEITKKL